MNYHHDTLTSMTTFLRYLSLTLLCALASTPADAQEKFRAALKTIHTIDQAARMQYEELRGKQLLEKDDSKLQELKAAEISLIERMAEGDRSNQKALKDLIAEFGWPDSTNVGQEGMNTLFLVVQHADLAFQEEYLPKLRESAYTGQIPNSTLALLEDRIRLRKGEMQIYGSQVSVENGVSLMPVLEPGTLDVRRASVGLEPVCIYLARFAKTYGPVTYAQCASDPANTSDLTRLQEVCKPDAAPFASLTHVQVRAVEAKGKDLPYFEGRSTITGGSVRIYHEPALAEVASSKAACFMGTLDLLAKVLPHMPATVAWSPMVLTRDAKYIPPNRDGEVRWVNVLTSENWDPTPMKFLLVTMPHEETHFGQSINGIQLPRWFGEGHAEWAGLLVTEQVRPDLAQAERTRRAEDHRALGAAHLSAWGGLRVKAADIERQLSAGDRERRKQDPSYVPQGPFTFGPDDLAEDNEGESGRYGAALALFTSLEQRHGRPAVMKWASAVIKGNDPKQIIPLAREIFGEDLTPLLQ